jgi:polar amino acid transport system substrate-binding protein
LGENRDLKKTHRYCNSLNRLILSGIEVTTIINLIISLFVVLGASITVLAANPPESIKAVHTLWFPYNYQDKEGKALGFENEIFKAVMENMNIRVEFSMLPWKRCLHQIQYGEADAVVSMLKVKERESYTIFSPEHISVSKTLLFVRKKSRIVFNGSLKDLQQYTFGLTRGFSYGPEFDSADFLNKEEVLDQTAIIRKVIRGRNDIGIGNQLVVAALAKKMEYGDEIRFLAPTIHTQKLYIGFSKVRGRYQLASDFSSALIKFKKSKAYFAILDKYGLKPSDLTVE